jgi:hypothetical protein
VPTAVARGWAADAAARAKAAAEAEAGLFISSINAAHARAVNRGNYELERLTERLRATELLCAALRSAPAGNAPPPALLAPAWTAADAGGGLDLDGVEHEAAALGFLDAAEANGIGHARGGGARGDDDDGGGGGREKSRAIAGAAGTVMDAATSATAAASRAEAAAAAPAAAAALALRRR